MGKDEYMDKEEYQEPSDYWYTINEQQTSYFAEEMNNPNLANPYRGCMWNSSPLRGAYLIDGSKDTEVWTDDGCMYITLFTPPIIFAALMVCMTFPVEEVMWDRSWSAAYTDYLNNVYRNLKNSMDHSEFLEHLREERKRIKITGESYVHRDLSNACTLPHTSLSYLEIPHPQLNKLVIPLGDSSTYWPNIINLLIKDPCESKYEEPKEKRWGMWGWLT